MDLVLELKKTNSTNNITYNPDWKDSCFNSVKKIISIIRSFYEMHDSKRDRRTLRTNE